MIEAGTVTRFVDDRGFGFIAPDDKQQNELFVHFSDVEGKAKLREGQRVAYTVECEGGRWKAKNVRVMP
jgi:CspA family cold shock protein